MGDSKNHISASVGVLTGLAMSASMASAAMAVVPVAQVDQDSPEVGNQVVNGAVQLQTDLVKTPAIGMFSFSQDYVSPIADIAKMQGVSKVACGGTTAVSQVRSADWTISVGGDVANAFSATIGELVDAGQSEPQLMTCSCGGNPAGGRAIVNAQVGGVSVESLLVESQASRDVNTVTFVAADGTRASVPLGYALGRHAVLGCEVNGQDIAESVGSANQLWMAKTPANYFVKNVVEVLFTVEGEMPPTPVASNPNSPNVGVLEATAL